MKRLKMILIGLTLAGCFGGWAQKDEQKIVVEITKEINGEKKTFKGEYNSPEEMQADPNYQEFAGEEDRNFWFDAGDNDVVIHLDQMTDLQHSVFRFFDDEDDAGGFFFHLDDDSSNLFDFKIADFDSDEFRQKMKDLGIEMSERFHRFNFEDDEDKGSVVDRKKIRVTDVEDEFGKRGMVEKNNVLALEDLSFYPNPSSNGTFKIRFNTPKEAELTITVSNLDGKDVFNRYFESFSGQYAETIDLSGQKAGIYLLEIIQGKKKVAKKVIIN